MSDLPSGWAVSTLGEATASGRPISYGVLKPGPYVTDGVPMLRIVDVAGYRVDLSSVHRISDGLNGEFSRTRLVGGELLLSIQGTVGRAAIFPASLGPANVSRTLAVIDPDERFSRYFLRFYFWYLALSSGFDAGGTTRDSLNISTIRAMRVPLPPVAEQERIVTAIEEAFSKLDAGEAALQATRQRLKRLGESVLAAAVTGRLVPQDPTDERALVNKASSAERSSGHYEIPADWSWCELNDVASLKDYGISAKAHARKEAHDVPMLRMGNIQGGAIDPTSLKYVNPNVEDISGKSLDAGDILFNRTNSAELVGKTAVYRGRPVGATFASYLIRVRTLPVALPAWCSSVINSVPGRVYISSVVVQQVGQANVNGTKLGRFPIPLPPVAEQHRIVDEMERQFSFIDACERTVDGGLVRSAALRRSILKSAFEGRLVPQDPADEPTAALLDRIQSERGAKDQLTKRRRRPKSRSSISGPDGLSAAIPASAQKRTRDPRTDSLNDTLRPTERRLG